MSETARFADAVGAIRTASALTESTFLRVGQNLEASTGILAELTTRFAAVLNELEGEKPGLARHALLAMATRMGELGASQSQETVRFEQMYSLTESLANRIARMKTSLQDLDSLAINAKIAAVQIRNQGNDFVTFANEIGRTLAGTRTALDRFAAELSIMRENVAAAQAGQLAFVAKQRAAAAVITQRLSTTVNSIALQHERATSASVEVTLGSARVRQRICDAILALQIGDITRQRLEHADHALGLIAGSGLGEDGRALDPDQKCLLAAGHCLLSALLDDAVQRFDHDTRQVIDSLDSLSGEAKALCTLGDAAYGATDRDGGSFLAELEGQVSEALALFESFATTQAEVATIAETVSAAAAGLCGQLRTVQSLEADIRIMGLNTTFRCARIGAEGLALGIIAQELRAYANEFAKAAATLMQEVEAVTRINDSQSGAIIASQTYDDGTQSARDALATLRQMEQTLDRAMAELERDSNRVVTLLTETVAGLALYGEIGQSLRAAAHQLRSSMPLGEVSFADLPPPAAQLLAMIERSYTMASERAVHARLLGRPEGAAAAAEASPATAVEDFLF